MSVITSKRYRATIKWLDTGDIQDDMILKIGDIEEDDDDIFFYLEDEGEIESFKRKAHTSGLFFRLKKKIKIRFGYVKLMSYICRSLVQLI